MKSSENRKFEEAWKEAFADAEGDVNDSVWNNIDSQLARAESDKMKKRVVFYKWLAAASVVFALVVGGVYWGEELIDKEGEEVGKGQLAVGRGGEGDSSGLIIDKEREEVGSRQLAVGKGGEGDSSGLIIDKGQTEVGSGQLAVGKGGEINKRQLTIDSSGLIVDKRQIEVGSPDALGRDADIHHGQDADIHRQRWQSAVGKGGEVDKEQLISKNNVQKKPGEEKILTDKITEAVIAKTDEGSKEEIKSPNVVSANEAAALNQIALAEIAPIENILKQIDTVALIESPIKIAKAKENKPADEGQTVKKRSTHNWWASVGGAAGGYLPNATSPSAGSTRANIGTLNSYSSTSASIGTAYSYGVNVGKQVTSRWTVISGVGVLNQSVDYTSNAAKSSTTNQSAVYVADFSSVETSATVSTTSTYDLRSTNEFITVPLQAGYLIIDKRIGVQVNAGIASDIFIRNSLVDPTGKLATSTQTAGDNSTYNTFNWTGLMGTELNYKFSKHYGVSLMPGVRYSFNSILKSSANSTITPFIFDVGFRLKYVF